MSKQNTLVLRAPSGQNSGEKKTNAGVGFLDSVTLTSGEKRSVVHFLPEAPMVKGKTIMVFPSRGYELPVEITGHVEVGDRNPSLSIEWIPYHRVKWSQETASNQGCV